MLNGHNRAKVFGADFGGSNQEKLGEAVTSTNTYYSLKFPLGQRDGTIAVHAGWTGTPTGTLTLWYTLLEKPNEANDADWIQDTAFATAAADPAGSAATTFVPGTGATGQWCRLKYVNASGSGNLWAYIAVGK